MVFKTLELKRVDPDQNIFSYKEGTKTYLTDFKYILKVC